MKNRDSGPLREHRYLVCFHHIYTPGADLFRPSNWRGVALGPRTVFFPLFVAPGAQKWRRRGPKGAQCDPKASKSLPGDLPKSMKNRLCGLGGCPGSPGRSRGTPPARKVHQKSLVVPPAAGAVACKNPPRLCNHCCTAHGVSGSTLRVVPSCTDACTTLRVHFSSLKLQYVTLVTFARACRKAVLPECGFPHTKTTPGEPKCCFTSPPQGLPPCRPLPFEGARGRPFS